MNEYACLSDLMYVGVFVGYKHTDTMYVGVFAGYKHTNKYQAPWGLISDAYKVDKDPFYLNGGKLCFSTT
jgi:hypothetical protein